jgi:predicted nucleic acid-binding protein
MYLLDTNVISELRKAGSGRADVNVVQWASVVAPISLFISAMTIFELELGILQIERRDEAQAKILRHWVDRHVLKAFEQRILAVDVAVAQQCAALHVPDPRASRDAFIAATALVHGLTVVTRNTKDFEGSGARLLNPWLG